MTDLKINERIEALYDLMEEDHSEGELYGLITLRKNGAGHCSNAVTPSDCLGLLLVWLLGMENNHGYSALSIIDNAKKVLSKVTAKDMSLQDLHRMIAITTLSVKQERDNEKG